MDLKSKSVRLVFTRICIILAVLLAIPAFICRAVGAEEDTKFSAEFKLKFESGTPPEETPETADYDIAVINLAGICLLRPDVETISFTGSSESFSLSELTSRLEQARQDSDIDAVLLSFDGIELELGQIRSLGKEISKLREAGKKVYAYSESYSQKEYLLAGLCDSVILAPAGELGLYGIAAESLYFKGLMDKLGITADIVSIGRFKSAAETVTRTTPSEADIEQTNALLDDIYGVMVDMIATSRNKSKEKVMELIDNGPYSAREALEKGLIDEVMFRDEFSAMIKKEHGDVGFHIDYGQKQERTLSLEGQSIFSVIQELLSNKSEPKYTGNLIAVVTIDGTIASGGGETYDGTTCGSETIRNILKECRNDKRIKAVVVRIDSPGGSALASDVIYNAIRLTAAAKPLVVSMGNVAASGGYYTACGAPYIFAEETTITGSIGVVGGKVCIGGLLDKIGISTHSFSRGRNAGMISSLTEFSPLERQKITSQMLETYSLFKERVLTGRSGRIKGDLENHAQGRVFSGLRAKELGLIDELGGFEQALTYIEGKASLKADDYELVWLPRPQTLMEAIESLLAVAQDDTGDNNATAGILTDLLGKKLGQYGISARRIYNSLTIMQDESIMTVMPYELMLKY